MVRSTRKQKTSKDQLHTAKELQKKEGEYQQQCECYESITLPPGIDKDKIDARYHSGLFTVTIPKIAAGKAKRIAVKAR